MQTYYVTFPAKKQAKLEKFELSTALQNNQVLIKGDYSLISAGTELANYLQLPNTVTAENSFPFHPGYSSSGTVIKTGPAVDTFAIGDRVVVPWHGHRSAYICSEDNIFKVPDGITQQEAAFAHISSFSFLGIRKLQIQIGEACVIAGLGLLGIIAVQIALLSGACPLICCDPSEERRKLAIKLGADYALDPTKDDFLKKIKEITGGKGPETVLEVSGQHSALQQALEYIAWEGRISLLGCTRISHTPIDFYKYIHKRGIKLLGSHTYTRAQKESKPGAWTEFDDYKTFFNLIKAKRMNVDKIADKYVSPENIENIYKELSTTENPPLGIMLDWNLMNRD